MTPICYFVYILDNGERESVDEIRHRIHSLRQMVEEEVGEKQLEDLKKSSKKRTESMDTGSLLSFTFGRSQNIYI